MKWVDLFDLKKWTLLLGVLLQCALASGQSFSAYVNKNPVAVNEVFQLSFKIENGNGRINYPDFSGMQILSGPNTSQSMEYINGRMSQSVTYYFQARVPREGTLTIGAASVSVNGKALKSKPIALKVVKGSSQPQAARPQNQQQSGQAGVSQDLMKQIGDNLFVKAFISKREAYVGEQITLTYKIYSNVTLADLKVLDLPETPGFWVENIKIENLKLQYETLNGVQFQAGPVYKAILIPQRSGELTIAPFKLDSKVRVTVQPSRRGNLFDSFFSRYQDVPYEPTAPAIKIKVKPLPQAGKPESFNGAVGDYSMDVNIDKTETETGEPVTLKVTLKGEGNLKKIETPKLKFASDFDVYDPKIDSRISVNSGRIKGSKSFDFLIIPLNPGEFKLPRLDFSYFDPKKERYIELNGPELSLKATGEAQMPISNMAPVTREDIELLNQDIRFIKAGDAKLKPKNSTFWASGGFWALSVLPFCVFGFLFWYKRKKDAEAGDMIGTRIKYATKVARKKLAVAEKLIAVEDKAFYNELDKALWGYLRDKLAMSPSELNRESASQKLVSLGVNEAARASLIRILDDCELALYAPVASEAEKNQLYQDTIALISDLEKQIS